MGPTPAKTRSPRIAVVGCGALGSFYGAKLCRAGHEVHFLLRSDYQAVRERGVEIRSVDGTFRAQPACARDPREIGPCDLVLVGLKTTANSEFARLILPLVGQGTLVVTLQNGLGNEELLAALIDPHRVLGALCFVCLNRIAPGVVLHTAHGHIVLGELQRPPLPRTRDLVALFRDAGIACELTENLAAAHWVKLVWNVPFNGLGVAGAAGYEAVLSGDLSPGAKLGPCLPTDQLLGEPRWEGLLRELMDEIITAARAKGYAVPEGTAEQQIERTRIMGAYKASTLIDFERGQPLELESMFEEPLRRARLAGVPTPRLAALCRLLGAMDRRNTSQPPARV